MISPKDTQGGSSKRLTVSTAELRIGMYVSELDRPWLGTPFFLQGFLIETQEDIDKLRNCCNFVIVDRTLSAGDQFQTQPRETQPRRLRTQQVEVGDPEVDNSGPKGAPPQPDFQKALRSLQQQEKQTGKDRGTRSAELRMRPVPQIRPYDQQSDIEEELVYAAPFYEELRDSLRNAIDTLQMDGIPDFGYIKENIGEVVHSIQRNPDAAIWLTQLRRTHQYTYDHCMDVSVYIVVFGRFLGLPPETLEMLGMAALMLDVGKSRIAPETLTKSEALTHEEFEQIRAHVAESCKMYRSTSDYDRNILQIIAQHHERHDGSGYPKGLAGDRICLYAEMAGVIDTYCAMIRLRPYRAPLSTQRGLEHLVKVRGTQFRELLVDQLIQCIGIYPVGSIVELNSGEVAVVVTQNQVRRLKPCVMILLGPDKTPDRRPRTLDLIYDHPTPTGGHYRIVRALPADAYGINPSNFFLD